MHKYKGIIFDLDGTLVNSLEDLIDSCNSIMKYYKFPTYSYDNGQKLIGRGLRNLIKDAIPEKYQDDEVFIDKLTEMLMAEYTTRYTKKTKPYPGILNLLNYLTANKIPMGVCTNKPDPMAKSLVNILFKDYKFVDVVGYTTDKLRKPNPESTLALAKQMGVKHEECLYVGDSTVDYETAINAEMLPVLCTWGFESRDVITRLERSIWVHNPMRIIDALLYGREMYSVFNEIPDPDPQKMKI
ncbi:HAD family hydrolase [Acetobacterium bakii]|uniref:Phosphoglycolate phosphatase n=1 Tax=Acetobacterium bakii TaxID=52689 RepID=A0A0L6U114_9FIRM|nr:HAD-IA family hydrolase [Acetobacterium bakii]KNZ42211.1 phosphoglycolate phosphatase [Acetobacterium bakii]